VSLLDMQRTLSRILTDRDFRAAFQADPVSAAAPYALEPAELASLTGLSWQRIDAQASMLAHNRLGLAFKALPLSERLLHDQMHHRMDEFCHDHPPVPVRGNAMLAEADRLLAFTLPRLADGRLKPRWAADVLRYEHAMTSLSVSADAHAGAARIGALDRAPEPADFATAIPVVGSHAAVLSFEHDVVGLVSRLEAGAVPDTARPARPPQRLLFVRPVDAVTVQRYAVNGPTAALIGLCDGRLPVAEVVTRLAGLLDHPRPAVEPIALGALSRLHDLGVLGFQKPTAGAKAES
jgi:hypothetical protein